MKRIVLQHPDGMMEIIGMSEVQPPDLISTPGGPINLVAVKRSYYLYRPVMSPSETMQEFHSRQE